MSPYTKTLSLSAKHGQYTDPFLLDWDPNNLMDFSPQDPILEDSGVDHNHGHAATNTALDPGGGDDRSRVPNLYSTPNWLQKLSPTIRQFNIEIVNDFIQAFVLYIQPVFTTFADMEITHHTLPDVVLAMAAVGGLYSKHKGSYRISIAMFTDARRLLLGRVSTPIAFGYIESLSRAADIYVGEIDQAARVQRYPNGRSPIIRILKVLTLAVFAVYRLRDFRLVEW